MESDSIWQSNVSPADWKNPTSVGAYHLVVLGAGTAGLVAAAGAAGLGAKVALIERHKMGGDCLNTGCVPSKSLLYSAREAAEQRRALAAAGYASKDGAENFAAAMQTMRRLRAEISSVDSAKRFKELGVDVYFGAGEFLSDDSIEVKSEDRSVSHLKFRKAVIATGARPSVPLIPGLESVDYLTSDTLFSLKQLPDRLAIIGGGPIGVEMAQAFSRFGTSVSLFQNADRILKRDDSDAARILQDRLTSEGVRIFTNCRQQQVYSSGEAIGLKGTADGVDFDVEVDQVLVATGRCPNLEGLNLDVVGVKCDQRGVSVNQYLQTSNRRIYAAGDVCSKLQLTHAADVQARIVIQNALFALGPLGRRNAGKQVIPWVTYTDPEVAQVGLTPEKASTEDELIDTYVQRLADVDRSILEEEQSGFIKVHVKRGTDRIVGATVVGANAGELISELTLAMSNGIGLSAIASTVHPYPTRADGIGKIGDQYNKTRLTSFSRRLIKLLLRFNAGG